MDRRSLVQAGLGSALVVAAASRALGASAGNPPASGARTALLNVRDFGAVGDGSADDTAAIQSAIDAARSAGGGAVWFPAGTYLLNGARGADGAKNGVLIPNSGQSGLASRVTLRGDGRSTVLRAGSAGMYIIRLSDSYCAVQDLAIDGNGLVGVSGLGLVPESILQTATRVDQNYNDIRNVEIRSCTEGLEMRAGPRVANADSGCWYNSFYDLNVYSCTRGIWLRAANGAGGSGANRNGFFGGRCGQAPMNTGLQIDSGGTNGFHGFHFEGIGNGRSPNAAPTAVRIANAGCDSNRFFGCDFAGNARDLDNANGYSEFYGSSISVALFTAYPLQLIGGSHASQVPQIIQGMRYQANSQLPGIPNNTAFFPSGLTSGSGELRSYRRTARSAPGGSTSSFDFSMPFALYAAYEIVAGFHEETTKPSQTGRRSLQVTETTSGSFVTDVTNFDVTTGAPAGFGVALSRVDASTLRVSVSAALSGGNTSACTQWAAVRRLA